VAFGSRRLIDVLREKHAAAQAQSQIRTEAASFRSWGRNWPAARQLQQDQGVTPGDLNPVGWGYSTARISRPNLRPGNAIPTLAQEAEAEERRGFLRTLRQRNREAQQRGMSELAQGGPYSDEDTAALRAISDSARENRVTGKEFLDYLRGRTRLPDETDNPNILTPEGRTAQSAQRLLNQYLEMKQRAGEGQGNLTEGYRGNVRTQGTGLLTSALPLPEEAFDPLGPAAGPVSRAYNYATSPVGAATAITMPGATAAGLFGQAGLGTAGEAAGVPGWAQIGLEVAGGLAPASLFTAPGRALRTGLRRPPVPEVPPIPQRMGAPGALSEPSLPVRPRPGLIEPDAMVPAPGQARELAPPLERTAAELPPGAVEDVVPSAAPNVPEGSAVPPQAVEPLAPSVAPEPGVAAQGAGALGGGAPLTAGQVQARQPQAIRQAASASNAREAREAWRLYDGANNAGNLERNVWANQVYQDARQAGLKINPRSPTPTDDSVSILEWAFGTGTGERSPIGNFPPRQQQIAQSLYGRLDETTQRLIAADPDFAQYALPEYFPHLFKVTKGRGTGARGFNVRPGFTRKRELTGTLGEILNNRPDLDLVTWDPVNFVTRHEAQVDNYINSLEAIRALKAKGVIVPARTPGVPATWRTPKIMPFNRRTFQGLVAEPKAAGLLEDMFGESIFDQYGALRVAKSARETLFKIKVFGGAFQGIDYAFRGAGLGLSELARGNVKGAARSWFSPLRAVARSAVPQLDRATLAAAERNPKLMALYRNGLAATVDPSISDQAIRGIGGIVPQTVAGRQIPGASGLAQVLDFVGGGAYQKFHTEMLEQAGLVNLEKNLRRGMPLEEAARVGAEETNVFFSSIPNWQSAVKSATGRDLMKFPFFATGELEGWFRIPFQAPAGFAGIIGTTVIAAEMLNKAFTGDWLNEDQLNPYDAKGFQELKDRPQNLLSFQGTGIFNTHFLRPILPWKGADGRVLYLDLLGQADTPFRWALDPVFATRTRLGQFPAAGFDIADITHGDAPMFGEKVESPQDLARFAAQELSPISVGALSGTEQQRIGGVGAGLQTTGLNISAERRADQAKREFEKAGVPFNPETWRTVAKGDPRFQHLLTVSDTKAKIAQALAPEEAKVLRFAQGVLRGDPQAGTAFREKISDLYKVAHGVSIDAYYGKDFPDPKSRDGKNLQAYRELDPSDPQWALPENEFATDWDAFFAEQDRLLGLMPPSLQASLREPPTVADPTLQKAINLYEKAKEDRDALGNISPIRGLTIKQYDQIRDLQRSAETWRKENPNPAGKWAPMPYAIKRVGQQQRLSPGLIKAAIRYNGGPTDRERNPAYIQFLMQHESGLMGTFYPELFDDQWYAQAKARAGRQ